MKTNNDEINQRSRKYLVATSLGWNMAVGLTVFTLLGVYVDRKRGGGIAMTLLGVALGLLYCGYEVWKVVRNDSSKKE